MKTGHLILMNGSSSAGKTSTCEAFQNLCPEMYLHLGIAEFWRSIPSKQLHITQASPEYYQAKTYYQEGKPYFQIMPGPLLDKVMCVSYQAIATYLEAGIDVISDQLFWKPEWFQHALEAFHPYSVFYVGLFVSDEEGAHREQQRSQKDPANIAYEHRRAGWNRCSALETHANMIYDIEIDNTHLSINETAEKLLQELNACKNPTAFKKLYQSLRVRSPDLY